MAMKRCPNCGEKYSDTYKYCPFCEEEEGLRSGSSRRRSGGRRASSDGPNILSPILIVIIVILAALLVYLFFGDSIRKTFSGKDDPAASVIGDASFDSSVDASTSIIQPDISGSGDSSDSTGDSSQEEPVDVSTLPETLTIAYLGSPRTEFSMSVGDDPIPLTVSGGSGTYQWSSSDDGIASVSQDGKVTAVSGGKITLTVTDGTGKGTCVVYVRGGTSSDGGTTQTNTSAALNKTDITIKVGEKAQLKVSGVTTALSWSSSNSGVATVASDGTVTGVGKGTATVTVSWDGNSQKCIVRVSG